jgi:hypothetical protein
MPVEMKGGLDVGSFAMFVDPETGLNAMGRVNYFKKNAGEPVVLMGVHALETDRGWERVDRASDYVTLPLNDVVKLSYSEYKNMQRAANTSPRVNRLRKKLKRVEAEMAKLQHLAVPQLGPNYAVQVDASDLDPEVLSWFHSSQGDPVYALESRLFAYGETMASIEELLAVESVLEWYFDSAGHGGDDTDTELNRIEDVLYAVKELLIEYSPEY